MKHAKTDSDRKKACGSTTSTEHSAREKEEARGRSDENLTAILAQSSQAKPGVCAANKQAGRGALKTVLKVEVAHVVKYEGDEPQFELVLADGSPSCWRHRGAHQSTSAPKHPGGPQGVIIKQVKGPAWDDYATRFCPWSRSACRQGRQHAEGLPESTIRRYLEKNGITDNAEHASPRSGRSESTGKSYVLNGLRMWTKLNSTLCRRKSLH
jgi:hypothetical protein